MDVRVDLCVDLANDAVRIDKECVAGSHHSVGSERTIFGDYLFIGVGEQTKGEAFFRTELLVRIDVIGADSNDGGLLRVVLGKIALEIMGFDGAATSHILWIEVQHHPLAVEILQTDRFALLRLQREVRRLCTYGWKIGGAKSGNRQSEGKHHNGCDGREESSHISLEWCGDGNSSAGREFSRRTDDAINLCAMHGPGDFIVRRATIEDLDLLVPLFDAYRQSYRKASDRVLARKFLLERFEREESIIFLAIQPNGTALGFTQLYPSFSSASAVRIFILNDLFVVPEARRTGVGRALLKTAEECGKTAGAARLTLSTEVTNVTAQALYESEGWVRQTDFYNYQLSWAAES